MTDKSGLFTGSAIPPEALDGLPAPIVAVSIGRSTWQGQRIRRPAQRPAR